MSKTRIAFIGAGNMAASLIGGLRAKGLEAAQIRASDPGEETRARVSAEHGIEVFADNAQAIEGADVVVLCGQATGDESRVRSDSPKPEARINWWCRLPPASPAPA